MALVDLCYSPAHAKVRSFIRRVGSGCCGRSGLYTAPQAAKLDVVKLKDDLFVIHNDFVPGNVTALNYQ